MGANGGYVRDLQATALQQGVHHIGVAACQGVGGQSGAVQFVVACAVERQQFGAQCCRKRSAGELQHLQLPLRELGQHAICTIE
ncbi:hypothetical protein D3C72_1986400 [compost metagenome]